MPAAETRKGTNSSVIRGRNERLILDLVRAHGALTKAEATRATGLSANATSVIFRALEDHGLLLRGEPIRGRIGQPSVPLRINPNAHHYVVLKIGRRNTELAVVNFAGEIVASRQDQVPFPTPSATLNFVKSHLTEVLRAAKQSRKTIDGAAVAMPFELWSWTADFGAPKSEMDAWRHFDPGTAFGEVLPWDVVIENDATAACRAETLFGSHRTKKNWIYLFIGAFIGGGVVLDGRVYTGSRGNAGGFGPLRVPDQARGNRLVDHASLVVLERMIAEAGGAPFDLYQPGADWSAFAPLVKIWIAEASHNLAHAIVSAMAVLDFEGVVIDGSLPAEVKADLIEQVERALDRTDLQGVHRPTIEPGTVGQKARTIGAAAKLIAAGDEGDPFSLS